MKLPTPVSQGLPFPTMVELGEYLATQGLEGISWRRRQGLMARWTLRAYDASGLEIRLEVVEDPGQLWLFGLPA